MDYLSIDFTNGVFSSGKAHVHPTPATTLSGTTQKPGIMVSLWCCYDEAITKARAKDPTVGRIPCKGSSRDRYSEAHPYCILQVRDGENGREYDEQPHHRVLWGDLTVDG